MKEDVKKESLDILKKLGDPVVSKNIQSTMNISLVDKFKISILSFYESRLNLLAKDVELKNIVEAKIKQKIIEDELSTPQLLGLLKALKAEDTIATSSLLEILKPVPNASSFMENSQPEENKTNAFSALTNEDSDALKEFTRFVLDYKGKAKEKEQKD